MAQKPTHPAVVFSRGSGVNGLASVRSLGRRGVEVHVVAKRGTKNLAAASRYAAEVHYLDEESPEAFMKAMDAIAARYAVKPVLLCDSDETIHIAALCAALLQEKFILISPLGRFAMMQDKEFQTRQAKAAGIAVPASWYITSWDDFKDIKPASGRRLIVKPNPAVFTATAPFKIFHADTPEHAAATLREFVESPNGMIVQEFIEGGDEFMWVVSGYASPNSAQLVAVPLSKTKQSGTGAGGVAIIGRTMPCPELKAAMPPLLKSLGYYGPFAIEFKYCARQKEYVFIEANYRTARVHVIGRRAGADLPAIIYADVTGQPDFWRSPENVTETSWYYDMRNCVETLPTTPDPKIRRAMIGHMLSAPFRKSEWAVFAWDDWKPTLVGWSGIVEEIWDRVKRRFRRWFLGEKKKLSA